ncbi:phage tail tape measure protein [Rhizobium sp. SA279]
MDISFVIRLIDQLTGPAKKVKSGLLDLGQAAKQGFSGAIKDGFTVENIETATRNAEAALRDARGRMLGAFGQAMTLAAPIFKGANFQDAFIDFANVAEIPIDRMGEIEARLIAQTRTTGKNKTELLQILATYVGKGMDLDESLAAIEATGRASTATKAEVGDMGNAGYAVMDNLKVAATDLAKAFDVMASTGKSGSFELKDMARNFPELTANASALKMQGVPAVASLAAALQIAMKSAGSADQAANNMSNFLGKITSPDTVKNFKKMGIDIEKEMKSAAAKGTDPLLHSLELIKKATGGDQYKMGELFADKQVLDFLRALIPNLEDYKRIRDEAGAASGVIDKDFVNVMSGLKTQIKGFVTEIDNLFSAGGALLPVVQGIVLRGTELVRMVNDWSTANPELTATIVKITAGLLAASVAMRVASYAFAAMRLSAIGFTSTFLRFQDGRNIATGWRIIAGAWRFAAGSASALGSALLPVAGRIPMLRNAIAGLSFISAASGGGLAGSLSAVTAALTAFASGLASIVAGITAPVWAIAAVLAAAGFAVWKYWDRISSFASGFAGPIVAFFNTGVEGVTKALSLLVDRIGSALNIDPATITAFKASMAKMFDFSAMIDAAKEKLGEIWKVITSFFSQEKLSDSDKEAMRAAGAALGTAVVDGFKAAFEALYSWLTGVPGRIRAAIGSIDLSGLIKPPAWMSGLFGSEEGAASMQPYQPQQSGAAAPAAGDTTSNVTINQNVTQNITSPDPKAAGDAAASKLESLSSVRSGAFNDGATP